MDHNDKIQMLKDIDELRALLRGLKPVESGATSLPGKRVLYFF